LEEEDRELFDPPDSYMDDEERQVPYNPFEDENLIKPLKKVPGGAWVSADDFPFAF